MRAITPPPDEEDDLLALCLALRAESGEPAVDALLARHPDSAEVVRGRLDELVRGGFPVRSRGAPPERIGGYRILGVLGSGGMGIVYEAEQERPTRRVALKVLRPLSEPRARARFRDEAECLARLQHPGIARVLDAGTAELGGTSVAFLALELVRGLPLDRHAEQHGLDARARLALLAKVADAVHHAHQQGVVHRDLKPENVLVDERGEPRVLDFGVARALDPDLRLETWRTEVGCLIGTPAYMSPEQAAGDPGRIDSQSDVWALGVLGYQLLARRLPIELAGRSALEALRAIQEEEAPPLGRLDRALRGDVETILAKALAKEPERRYSSAHELAADIRRHLEHRPIAARPATATYHLAKLARRHRAAVLAAALFVLALALGLASTTHALLRASRERAQAERRLGQASAVLDFQRRMFAAAGADEELRVDELLGRAERLLGGPPGASAAASGAASASGASAAAGAAGNHDSSGGPDSPDRHDSPDRPSSSEGPSSGADRPSPASPLIALGASGTLGASGAPMDPTHEAAVRLLLGRAYRGIGRFEQALTLVGAALASFERELGPDDRQSLAARCELAALLGRSLGRLEEAEQALAGVPERAERIFGPAHDATLAARLAEAELRYERGRFRESAELARAVARLAGPEHPAWITARQTLARALGPLGETDEAIAVAREVLDRQRAELGNEDPETWSALDTLGTLLQHRGRLAEGAALIEELVLLRTRFLGADHPHTLNARTNLAVGLQQRGEHERAEALLLEVLAACERERAPDHPARLFALNVLGNVHLGQGRAADAELVFREVLERTHELRGPEHRDTLSSMQNLAVALRRIGRAGEAEELYRETLAVQRRTLGERHADTLTSTVNLGFLYTSLGRLTEGEALLREAVDVARTALGPDDVAVPGYLVGLTENLILQGRLDEAEPLAREALTRAERTEPGDRAPTRRKAQGLLEAIAARRTSAAHAESTAPDGL